MDTENTPPNLPARADKYVLTYEIYSSRSATECSEAIDKILNTVQEVIKGNASPLTKEYLDETESILMALYDLVEEKEPSMIHSIQ